MREPWHRPCFSLISLCAVLLDLKLLCCCCCRVSQFIWTLKNSYGLVSMSMSKKVGVQQKKKKKNNVAISFTCSREALYYDLILGSLSWRIRLELLLYIIQEYSLNIFAFFPVN